MTWQLVTKGYKPLWAPNTAYAAGAQVIDSNGNLETAVAAGTSGSTHPTWPTKPGAAFSDGAEGLMSAVCNSDLQMVRVIMLPLLLPSPELSPSPIRLENPRVSSPSRVWGAIRFSGSLPATGLRSRTTGGTSIACPENRTKLTASMSLPRPSPWIPPSPPPVFPRLVGALEGNDTVNLEINNATAGTENVTLAGGASQLVQFTEIELIPGNYTVQVGDLTGMFVVNPAPPGSSKIILSNMVINPYEAWPNQPVNVTATAENPTKQADSLYVTVTVDGASVQGRLIQCNASTTETVEFSVNATTIGTHTVK